jgi:ABC-type transport system involved in multi-copper enzyme maturation permease subunit
MSAVGATPPVAAAAWDPRRRVTQLHVIRSEWTKLYSVRSTLWSFFAAVVITIGLSAAFAAAISSHWSRMSPADQARHHGVNIALAGIDLSQLAIGVLGVLVISAEYSTGMIRSTMTAVPKRLPALWAKVIVFALATITLMAPSALIAFFVCEAIVGHIPQLHESLSDPGVARGLIGGVLYVTVFGLASLAFGALTRNTAAGIAAIVAVFFVIPGILDVGLPSSWNNLISPYLPSNAGRDLFTSTGTGTLSPWGGFALFVGYTVIVLGLAAAMLRRRDV